MLDYLFSRNKGELAYGTKLLEAVSNEKLYKGKGLFQYYWIHPVSVFSNAMQAAFQEKSIQHLEENWQLARGADPINTPHLFRASLYEFMSAQLDKLIFTEKDIYAFLLENPVPQEKPRSGKKRSSSTIRNWARSAFRVFIDRFSATYGAPEGSSLREGVLDLFKSSPLLKPANDLKERLQQILYLKAYSMGFDTQTLVHEFEGFLECFELFKNRHKENAEMREFISKVDVQIDHLANAIYGISGKYS